jgi:Short C-terminal domain/Bacterial PH domain
MSWFRWLRPPSVRERLAPYDLRPDVLAAAAAMASDQRSDVYVAKLESSLMDSETVLRMMDGRYAGEMGLLVLTSKRILFRSRRSTGPTAFSMPLGEIIAIEGSTRRVSGTVRVTTSEGTVTVDQILGTQGEMLANDAREAIRGEARPERDPLQVLAELRALRDSGMISDAEFEIRKSAIWPHI